MLIRWKHQNLWQTFKIMSFGHVTHILCFEIMNIEKLLNSAGFPYMILQKKVFFEKSQNFEMCLMDVNKSIFFSNLSLFLRFGRTYRCSESIMNTLNFELKIEIKNNFKSYGKTACFFWASKFDNYPNIRRHTTKTSCKDNVSLLWDVLTWQDYNLRQIIYF